MSWNYYQDLQGDEPEVVSKPKASPPDFTNLILLGLGLLGGYLLFSEDKNEKELEKNKLDNLDKAVANKTDIHFNPNFIFGGKGDNLKPEDVDQVQLKKGIKVEMEHTNKPEIAQEIALDHLAEDKKYYDKLETIHKENPIFSKPKEVKTLNDLRDFGKALRTTYGRSVLPSMKDEHGNPTEIALMAQTLGLKIPKTKKEAKELARKGTEALRKHKELRKSGVKKNDSIDYKV